MAAHGAAGRDANAERHEMIANSVKYYVRYDWMLERATDDELRAALEAAILYRRNLAAKATESPGASPKRKDSGVSRDRGAGGGTPEGWKGRRPQSFTGGHDEV